MSGHYQPDICRLSHRMFSVLSIRCFQRAESDGAPVMVIELGEKPALLQIRSVMREFDIAPESADGRTLAMIEQALDFVEFIKPGDPFPAEILSGRASWEPDAAHRAIAAARLKVQLVQWLSKDADASARDDPKALVNLVDTPHMREAIQQAMEDAAREIGVANGRAVVAMIDDIAEELAYIEALRERLLQRVEAMSRKLNGSLPSRRSDGNSFVVFTQVQRLLATPLGRFRDRFEEIDGQTGEVLAALRHIDGQKEFIRTNRDWLYCSLRAWDPILSRWDGLSETPGPALRPLLMPTYQFLARRYMPATEWLQQHEDAKPAEPTAMTW